MGEKISHSSDFLAHHLRSSQNRSLFKPGLLKCFGVSLSDSEKKKKKGAQTGTCGRGEEV